MLDGLMGRGFRVKCKSLIKRTRARIDVVRRRTEAKQRFLKEDLGKLLSNGLDINAYGRTEEFMAGMNLLSSYDIVEQSCEFIVKQLSRMQKQGECPEECREAVASLMFAAARFADLPELRDLRDMFLQRYGNCLEVFVSQKFVEKLSSRPPATEKRLQVLQDIASEFSIKWDSRGCEQRMVTPSVAQTEVQQVDIAKQKSELVDVKNTGHNFPEGNMWRRDEADHKMGARKGTVEYTEHSLLKRGGRSLQGEHDRVFHGRHTLTENEQPYSIEEGYMELKVENSSISSHGKMLNYVHTGYVRPSNDMRSPRKGGSTGTLFHEKAEFVPAQVEHVEKAENVSSCKYSREDDGFNFRSRHKGSARMKSVSNYAILPSYVKLSEKIARPPYVRPEEDRHSEVSEDPSSNMGRHFLDHSSGRYHSESDHLDFEEIRAPSKVRSNERQKYLNYQEEKIPLPKPRSIRRKHLKSSSSYDEDTPEDVDSASRSSNSKRKDHSRKGLQILFDVEHHRKDDEERMIDKLLIHYSKKPSSYDAGKMGKKVSGQPSDQVITNVGESSMVRNRNANDGRCEVVPPPTRSVSLPPEQTVSPELKNVFNRANSFQPDNQARHVHPKLPDYDDLAARFAALKGR